jgi:hypothetical protein
MRPITKVLLASIFMMIMMSFQLIKTQISITVRNELGNTVEGATIQLFETEEDYKTEKNIAAQGFTDKKGVIKLKDLKATSYFVIAKKDDKDNSGGGEQTGKLEANKINKVTIIIQ